MRKTIQDINARLLGKGLGMQDGEKINQKILIERKKEIDRKIGRN